MNSVEGISTSRPNARPGVTEKERTPICAFVSPNIREQQVNHFASTLKVNQLHSSQWSVFDTNSTAPRIVLEKHSPAISLKSLIPPPPPPYSSSDTHRAETSLTPPDITINASNTSQDDSRSPLLQSSVLATKPLSVDVHELRAALRQQKERLKATTSQLKAPSTSMLNTEEERHNLNTSNNSIHSIKSEVVRQAAKTANNKENFNYLAGSQKLDTEEKVDWIEHATRVEGRTVGIMQCEGEAENGNNSLSSSTNRIRTEALINKSIQEENGELVEKSSLSIDFDSESDEEVSQADPVHPKLNSSHLLGTV